MISTAPFRKLLVEKDMSLKELSELSGLDYPLLAAVADDGKRLSSKNLNVLCRVLDCQPCDIMRFERNS